MLNGYHSKYFVNSSCEIHFLKIGVIISCTHTHTLIYSALRRKKMSYFLI